MHTETLEYNDGQQKCKAFVASADATSKRPAVLISHAWGGQGEFEQEKARKLAELGYVGFALDNYGDGKTGASMDENSKLMQPFMDDRAKLRQRLLAGMAAAKNHSAVDSSKIAIIGFCFGGLCALDLARAATDLKGAVSFHGLFNPPDLGAQQEIAAKVLILHGWDDPMAKPDAVLAVAKEMTDAKADWQIQAYGHTSHAFTNPQANMPENGMQYKASADKRSWQSMKNFLEEIFA